MSARGIIPNPLAHIHEPSNDQWDLIGLIMLISALAIVMVIVLYMMWVVTPTTNAMIDSLSCGELKEYIMDKEKFWGNAVHRYTWMCEK